MRREWLALQDLLEQQARTAQLAPRELLAHKDRKALQALRVQQAQQAQVAVASPLCRARSTASLLTR